MQTNSGEDELDHKKVQDADNPADSLIETFPQSEVPEYMLIIITILPHTQMETRRTEKGLFFA